MPKVEKQREFTKSADEVWSVIGDFHGMHKWVDVEPSESVEDGKARRFAMGPNKITERLLDSTDRSYTYEIVDGPLPVANYRSTLSVRDGEGGGSVVEWVGTFEPAPGATEESATQIVEMVYEGGLAAMEKKFA